MKIKCCFCGKVINGYGNSTWPIHDDGDLMERCCDDCNWNIVIKARLKMMKEGKEDGIQETSEQFWLNN